MNHPVDLEQARFLSAWSGFIDRWARKTLAGHGGAADLDDLRQEARLAAWLGYQEWRALAESDRDATRLPTIVARKIKDALLDEWSRQRQRPRDAHQRGGGAAAELFRDYLDALAHANRADYVRGRYELIARSLTAYHLAMAGTVHGSTGLVSAERAMVRQEVIDRIAYALEKIGDVERGIIEGVYFQGRTLAEVGAELGVRGRSSQSRRHRRALDEMRKYMDEYASALGPRNTGGTLDDEPGDGD